MRSEKTETIPTIIKIGNAISTNPFTTRKIKNSGNKIIEHIIFEIPQAALIANFNILPNTKNIKNKKITGYLKINNKPIVVINQNGINETIFKNIIEEIEIQEKLIDTFDRH